MTWQGKRRKQLPSLRPIARRMARRRAKAFGWFWLPCPLCATPFSGAEWDRACINDPAYATGTGHGRGICPWCAAAGKGEETLDLSRLA